MSLQFVKLSNIWDRFNRLKDKFTIKYRSAKVIVDVEMYNANIVFEVEFISNHGTITKYWCNGMGKPKDYCNILEYGEEDIELTKEQEDAIIKYASKNR